MTVRRTITLAAPAKVNLALSVGAPSPAHGGLHPISSWMVTVDLVDDLTLTRLEDDGLSMYAILWAEDAKRRSEIDWSVTRDLAVRAHQAVEAHVGRQLPIKMKLEKRIPVGGGLGGGSSNAAAMLRGVNELFDLGLDQLTLTRLGASLGSDVPFLVRGGSALVEGVGEALEHHAQVPELHMVLVLPEAACPTGPVYGAFDRLRPGADLDAARVRALARTALEAAMPGGHEGSARAPLDVALPFNDLAAPAFEIAPSLAEDAAEIAEIVERPVHVSGSGSTLFFLCSGRLEAELLAEAVVQRLHLPAVAVKSTATPGFRG
ncbi:MAG: 4-(cytidine 5'-diphospho)-2-C-methyl-D-erythritol kinase [Phycisphaeraceae bacterium]|nr:4-(cytidine 5'-diphospho)-2-C-methyl-D-erythritol kinase [Phycisphaeraceae bacterium]